MEAVQGEINHVLKRVQEGIDVFDTLWKKVYDSDNGNHTENNQNVEADLKKEIKKLRRYREEMKTWMQSNEIKASSNYEQHLKNARELIEREMERFKIREKDTKRHIS
ncbi:CCR4-NOT transcription complex subunit 3 [Tanacetum coccineum]